MAGAEKKKHEKRTTRIFRDYSFDCFYRYLLLLPGRERWSLCVLLICSFTVPLYPLQFRFIVQLFLSVTIVGYPESSLATRTHKFYSHTRKTKKKGRKRRKKEKKKSLHQPMYNQHDHGSLFLTCVPGILKLKTALQLQHCSADQGKMRGSLLSTARHRISSHLISGHSISSSGEGGEDTK